MQSYLCKSINDSNHLLMDGGKLNIPKNNTEFWKWYQKNYTKGISLIERSNSIHTRFFLDIDVKDNLFSINDFIRLESKTFEDKNSYVISTRESNGIIKGVHITYHNITYTSPEQALTICEKFMFANPDLSVYKTGLRMIGAIKKNNVFSSENIYLPRLYVTRGVINTLEPIVNIQSINMTKIRLSNENIEPNVKSKTVKDVEDGIEIPELINIDKKYANITVSIQYHLNDIFLFNTNCKYCKNIQKEHKNANIYFVANISKRTISQRCFCRCVDKTCSTYKSSEINMNYNTFLMLVDIYLNSI